MEPRTRSSPSPLGGCTNAQADQPALVRVYSETLAQAVFLASTAAICSRCLGKPPNSPYPPDLAEDAVPVTDLEDLVDAVVVDRDWANRPARGLVARRVELRRCRLTGAELAEAMLSDVAFDDCRLDLAGLRVAKLERVVFRECRIAECDFYDASLTEVLFEDCELRKATFNGVKLKRVELRGCDLSGLRGVEALRGARMPWNDVKRPRLGDAQPQLVASYWFGVRCVNLFE